MTTKDQIIECKECLLVADTPIPLCNYHQGYKKAQQEELEFLGSLKRFTIRKEAFKLLEERIAKLKEIRNARP